MNKIQLENIANQIGDSFFVYTKERVTSVYNDLRNSLGTKGEIAFSIKSNYCPSVITDLQKLGSWFEVSSQDEYEYLISLGVDLKQVVINAPVSSTKFIIKCLNSESIFNVQNEQQWIDCKSIAGVAPNKKVKIGLRLNLGYTSRFGISETFFNQVLKGLTEQKNIEVISLHVHVCEGGREIKSFEEKFNRLNELSKNKILGNIKFLNIGGGFYSSMPDFLRDQFNDIIPTFDEYLELFSELSAQTQCKIMIEPGGLLVSNAMKFYTKVLSVDSLAKNTFIQLDGSVYDVQPTKSSKQLPYNVVTETKHLVEGQVVGFTCMEDDILIKSFSGNIEKGDWIEFTNVGAYAQTLRPAFISSWKPIVSCDIESFKVLRSKADKLNLFSQWI